jgi:hypothetical protein
METVKKHRRIFLKSGVDFTPELEEDLAAEAERGYDLSKARRRFLKRPPLADGESPPTVAFTIPQDQFNRVRQRAEEEGRTVSDLAREALKRYMAG